MSDEFEGIEFEDEPAENKPEEKKEMSADEFIDKLFSILAEFKKKKKYPYPYPYPKKDKKMEAENKELKDKLASFEELQKERDLLKEKVASFEKRDIDEKTSQLIALQKEAGIVTDENLKETSEKFSTFSSDQLDALITQFKSFSAKKPEAKGKKDFAAEKSAEISKIEEKIKDFNEAGLKTAELESQLKNLKGE